jgi:hypothetical protein
MGGLRRDAGKMGVHHKAAKPDRCKAALRCRNAAALCENPAVATDPTVRKR